ncbi:MAG TPA: nucleoside triphosphate pyrophosphohydrolase [Agitococcus sp.]|nr:nucleoside triphosphate pyrophosphohydrolase [Agitococcus sp.]HMV61411.1 nucleoside triphosphate pyrophosphohydrolase [Agitococcus sp.]HMY00171.1 nucleoside triphosphate pyrophosphohydrolase [Agitococcus sp.]HMY28549.1 nucleoside triphosphate pyrophosphohydrolase [Agitococcus sp.]HNC03479.1 nucleoside triphosphate pyrophosphohydrolase [Agitococcus sp.]
MSYNIDDLRQIMVQLRSENGCNWDKQQSFESLVPYAIEEAHEVAEAVINKNYQHLCEELGDLLLQVVFHAQIAQEQQLFSFDDVVNGISEKMIRRHPHVFAEQHDLTPEQVSQQWATIKAQEKQNQLQDYLLDSVSLGRPALSVAEKLQKTVAKVGFDWPDVRAVMLKIREELKEIEAAFQETPEKLEEEIGDLLFCVVNLMRHLKLDSEQTLKKANAKFVRRFNFVEEQLKIRHKNLTDSDLAEMEHLWQLAKSTMQPQE